MDTRGSKIEIPVAMGETVYSVVGTCVVAFVVVKVDIELVGKHCERCEYRAENGDYPMRFNLENIGKDVFLTYDEAQREKIAKWGEEHGS